jgi:hypothetical protein
MLSPSLVAMILHSVWPALGTQRPPQDFADVADFVRDIQRQIATYEVSPYPTVPVVGRTRAPQRLDAFRAYATFTEQGFGGAIAVFGRVPVDVLVRHFAQHYAVASDDEFLDLGTPLQLQQSRPAAGSAAEANCAGLLAKALQSTKTKTVRIGLVDQGVDAPNQSPNDFSGALQHLETQDIAMSEHAMQVLSVLLDRLDFLHILDEVEFYCALVREPKNMVGRHCFDHASAAELQHAFYRLQPVALSGQTPFVTSVSMGTHVGPHNGNSPLEDFLRASAQVSRDRFLVAAAGNHGRKGIAAQRELVGGVREYMRVHTGPDGCGELLIEFWWREPVQSTVTLSVDVTLRNGSPLFRAIGIDPHTACSLTSAAYQSTVLCESLYQSRCHLDMSCIAFAMSSSNPADLKDLTIDFSMEAQADVVINAWVVVSEDPATAFVTGGAQGSLTVPATEPWALSIAGVERNGQPWADSSRGPSARYDSPGSALTQIGGPYMAHLVALGAGGLRGTSYATPRAAADIAALAIDPRRPGGLHTAEDVAKAVLRTSGGLLSPFWSPRTGFGAITR